MSESTPPGNSQRIKLNFGPLDGIERRHPMYPGLYGEVQQGGGPISVYAPVPVINDQDQTVMPYVYQGPVFPSPGPMSARS
jgi:hypothetical protein